MKLYTVADLAAMAGVGIQMIRNRLREHHIKPADWRTFKSRTGGARQALYPPMDIILKTEAQMLEEKGWIKIPRLREAFGTTQFRLMTFLKGCGAEHVDVHHDKKTMTLWRLPGGGGLPAFRTAWVAWHDKLAAERAEKEAEIRRQLDNVEEDDDPPGDWLEYVPEGFVKDMVLAERETKKLIGKEVVVHPVRRQPYVATLEWYNVAGFAVRLRDGRYRQYVAHKAKVEAIKDKEEK